MMEQALRNPAKMASWLEKGRRRGAGVLRRRPLAVPQTHVAWLDRLQLMHVDAHRVYVHAGVDPKFPLDRQDEVTMLWKALSEGIQARLRRTSRGPWSRQ